VLVAFFIDTVALLNDYECVYLVSILRLLFKKFGGKIGGRALWNCCWLHESKEKSLRGIVSGYSSRHERIKSWRRIKGLESVTANCSTEGANRKLPFWANSNPHDRFAHNSLSFARIKLKPS
jgi:hypothetical protein